MSKQVMITSCLLLFSLLACKETNITHEKVGSMAEEKGLDCYVVVPAGDRYEDFSDLDLPPFFNIGEFKSNAQNKEAIILTKRTSKGSKVKVDVIGLFRFQQDEQVRQYIVTLPRQQGLTNLERNYEEFLAINGDLKLSIETWFRAQCGLSECGSFTWDNAYKALLQLDESQ